MSDTVSKLPTDFLAWRDKVVEHNLENETIHTAALASASKIAMEQFLLFRVLWKVYRNRQRLHTMLGMKDWIAQANTMLAGYQSWSRYCESIGPSKSIPEGTFALARHCQLEVAKTDPEAQGDDDRQFSTPVKPRSRVQTRLQRRLEEKMASIHLETPVKDKGKAPALFNKPALSESWADSFTLDEADDEPSPFRPVTPVPTELVSVLYPPTKDEQIVNTALVIFLKALTMHFDFSSNWTLHRRAFTAVFDDAQFEARTDGYLDDHRGMPSVLIEVKPALRDNRLVPIQMQESAQVVAWIKSDSESNQKRRKTRVHLSQDRHQVFITVAEYGEDYLSYLNNETSALKKPPSFLTMHQFGPWDTLEASHMRELGPLLLAISLKAEHESKGQ